MSVGRFVRAGHWPTLLAVLLELGARWSAQWHADAVRQAGVYSYRNALIPDVERAA